MNRFLPKRWTYSQMWRYQTSRGIEHSNKKKTAIVNTDIIYCQI